MTHAARTLDARDLKDVGGRDGHVRGWSIGESRGSGDGNVLQGALELALVIR
jgi:hypothetical protein